MNTAFLRLRAAFVVAVVATAVASCMAADTIRPTDVLGEWSRPGDSFPPVNLTLSDSGSGLRARLRLSGTETHGSATIEGHQLRLALDGRPEMSGEWVSKTELRLHFGGTAGSYTLYPAAIDARPAR
jgi:hypothetical protein